MNVQSFGMSMLAAKTALKHIESWATCTIGAWDARLTGQKPCVIIEKPQNRAIYFRKSNWMSRLTKGNYKKDRRV